MTNESAIAERIEEKLDALLEQSAQPSVRWLTISGASDYTSLSEKTIRRAISSGKLQSHRLCKGRILLDRQELDSVISTSTKPVRKGRGKR